MNDKQLARLKKILDRKESLNYSRIAREMHSTPATVRHTIIMHGLVPIEDR